MKILKRFSFLWFKTSIVCFAIIVSFSLLTGCNTKALENQVQSLTQDKTNLSNQVQSLTQDKTSLSNQVQSLTQDKTNLQQQISKKSSLIILKIGTEYYSPPGKNSISIYGGVESKSFPQKFDKPVYVSFYYTGMNHYGLVRVKCNIYLVYGGDLLDEKNMSDYKSVSPSVTDFSWENFFDISSYSWGEYQAIVTLTDLINGAACSATTNFSIQ